MSKILIHLITSLAILLAGCSVGTNFVRPDSDSVQNRQTRYADVVAKFGPPRREGQLVKNEKAVKTVSYVYVSAAGPVHTPGAMPARGMTYYFVDDVLVGHEFVSTWVEDHTDFDESKVSEILKGKTTRSEVVALLGKPGGYYTYPLIKAQTGDALVYAYTAGVPLIEEGGRMGRVRKMLVVNVDPGGIVSDIDYTYSNDLKRAGAPAAR